MDRMIDGWIKGQSPQQKREMMAKMMPRMMEGMGAEDMMAMMKGYMESIGSGNMMETMCEMMPRMMENCLTPMSQEERHKMLGFCRTMLGDMEARFGVTTEKGGRDER